MSRTHRLFQLMQSLRRLPGPVTAARLAEETGVSMRTLYRDIDALRGLGAVIEGAAGYGYTLIEDASLPPLSFVDEEIEALVVGLREVEQVGDPSLAAAASSALAKLRARLPDSQARRFHHAVLSAHRFYPIPEPGVDASALRRAAWNEVQVRFNYEDGQGRQTTREVRPLGIVFMDHTHCLLAWCLLRDGHRSFRLDRMRDLEITETSFRPSRTPLLRAHLDMIRESAKSREWRN